MARVKNRCAVAFSHQTIVKFILKMHLGFQLQQLGLQMVLPVRNSKMHLGIQMVHLGIQVVRPVRNSIGAFRNSIGAFSYSSGAPNHEFKTCI